MNLTRVVFMVALAALFVLPGALAYRTVYSSYGSYGQPRIGAYTTSYTYAQGMYDYVSPPIGLTRYGADYYYGSNIRSAVYPQYPVARVPNLYQPYYGYPYGSYGNYAWMRYKYYAFH